MLTVSEAAKVLKVTPRRVTKLIEQKRLPAKWIGGWGIDRPDLELVKVRRPGRPPNKTPDVKKPTRSKA
ncbi:MAG: helix-turn-helix domain-containing protein [Tepidisphaeraceae bacterium]|jgi:excisionase family DNA binding protein